MQIAADGTRILATDAGFDIISPTDGTARLVAADGKASALPVKRGHNRYTLDNAGIYIVLCNGSTLKILHR